jgi:four helix bundle protein
MSKSKKSTALKDLRVYQLAHDVGKRISEIVIQWDNFNKHTLGRQFVRAADSISLNICEGYGRFYYKENKMFCYYSRGSLIETAECLIKAKERNLISETNYLIIAEKLRRLKITLNKYIDSIGKQSINASGKENQENSGIRNPNH